MTSHTIHFGTSGWRGIIARDFTFSGVRRASKAIARHVRASSKKPILIVGHDTRFLSEDFALSAADVMRSEGCRVFLCGAPAPTPAISHAILHNRFDGGVNITASHNPAPYNGLKFYGPDGGPALPKVTKDIEKRAAAAEDDPGGHHEIQNDFEQIDPRGPYFEQLRSMIRFDVLRRAGGGFICDALHGCGAGWLDRILEEEQINIISIRAQRDVLFEGAGPDPSEENLAPLRKAVTAQKALAGLATDGDAGRFGIVDRDGSFVSPNHILALVFDYLLETRKDKLGASRSVATTHLIDAVAKLHGVETYQTPVGFKYVGPLLRENKIALGGEESAGITIRGHLPEKDGILACLLVGEMIAARQKSLAAQLRDLFKRVGREYWPIRVNLHLPEETHAKLPDRLNAGFKKFAGRQVAKVDRIDGLQMTFKDGSWLLMRPSGAEPLVRVCAEAETLAASEKLADHARAWIVQ